MPSKAETENIKLISSALRSVESLIIRNCDLSDPCELNLQPIVPFPKKKVIDKASPKAASQNSLFLFYKHCHDLLVNSKKNVISQQESRTIDELPKRLFKQALEQLNTLFTNHNAVFLEMLQDDHSNNVLLYLSFLDLINYQHLFYSDELCPMTLSFVANQKSSLQTLLIFLSPLSSRNNALYNSMLDFASVNEITDPNQQLITLGEKLASFSHDFSAYPCYFSDYIKNIFTSHTLNIIESNAMQPLLKQHLTLLSIVTFGFVKSESAPVMSYLGLYHTISQTLKNQLLGHGLYQTEKNFHRHLLLDISERHLKEFNPLSQVSQFNLDELMALTYSIEMLLLNIESHTVWPLKHIEEPYFWLICTKVLLKPGFSADQNFALQWYKIMQPVSKGLLKFGQYEALQILISGVLQLSGYRVTHQNFNASEYQFLEQLLTMFKETGQLKRLEEAQIKTYLSHPEGTCLYLIFIRHMTNALFHLAQRELSSNKAVQTIKLFTAFEEIFKKDSATQGNGLKEQFAELRKFLFVFSKLIITNDPSMFDRFLKNKLRLELFQKLFDDNRFSGLHALRKSICQSLFLLIYQNDPASKGQDKPSRRQIFSILNFAMPVLKIMQLTALEDNLLKDIFTNFAAQKNKPQSAKDDFYLLPDIDEPPAEIPPVIIDSALVESMEKSAPAAKTKSTKSKKKKKAAKKIACKKAKEQSESLVAQKCNEDDLVSNITLSQDCQFDSDATLNSSNHTEPQKEIAVEQDSLQDSLSDTRIEETEPNHLALEEHSFSKSPNIDSLVLPVIDHIGLETSCSSLCSSDTEDNEGFQVVSRKKLPKNASIKPLGSERQKSDSTTNTTPKKPVTKESHQVIPASLTVSCEVEFPPLKEQKLKAQKSPVQSVTSAKRITAVNQSEPSKMVAYASKSQGAETAANCIVESKKEAKNEVIQPVEALTIREDITAKQDTLVPTTKCDKSDALSKSTQTVVAFNSQQFFQPVPAIVKDKVPKTLFELSAKIEAKFGLPLIITGKAVSIMLTGQGVINDYDCLICNVDLALLKEKLEQWGYIKSEHRSKGKPNSIIYIELNEGDSTIKVDISCLIFNRPEDLPQALYNDASKRDLLNTTLHLPLYKSTSSHFIIHDSLKALPYVMKNIVEINLVLDAHIKNVSLMASDFFIDDPIRLLRLMKELIEQQRFSHSLGNLLAYYFSYIRSSDYQCQLWRGYLVEHSNYRANISRVQDKLQTIFSRYVAVGAANITHIFDLFKYFNFLEGLTGLSVDGIELCYTTATLAAQDNGNEAHAFMLFYLSVCAILFITATEQPELDIVSNNTFFNIVLLDPRYSPASCQEFTVLKRHYLNNMPIDSEQCPLASTVTECVHKAFALHFEHFESMNP